ncbi:MAG: phosphorylase family protein [Armatimonadota bacterium]
MPRPLSPRPDLHQLKRQAKELLKAQQNHQPEACQVFRHLTRFAKVADVEILQAHLTLAEAQFALAMEYGFPSWHALRQHVLSITSGEMPTPPGKGAITAKRMLSDKGLDASTFHFPIAIAYYFKGMADLPWWQWHSARFGAKRINSPKSDDSLLHWGKVLSSCPISIWNIETDGVPIIFVGPLLYGPWGAAALEELKVFGLEYVIGVGAAGAFSERLSMGDILIADCAIVSDGASKAYTDEPMVYSSPYMKSLAEETVRHQGLPVNHTCVWQSDALYRESLDARHAWRQHGAECVNCETSTLYAVSEELGIESVNLIWITDSTVSGTWSGWGKGSIPPPDHDGHVPPPNPVSPLVIMEDLAIEMAREIKRDKFGTP